MPKDMAIYRRAGGVCNSWAGHPKSLDALQKAVKPLYCEFPLGLARQA